MPTDCGDYDTWNKKLNALLSRLGGGAPGFDVGTLWSPPTDVFETEEGVVVKMELPGIRPEDLSIALVDDRLVVKGRRIDPDAGRKIQYHQMEIAHGPFAKVVHLRIPYDREGISAKLKDGYLSLTIPRTTKPVPERVAVEIRL